MLKRGDLKTSAIVSSEKSYWRTLLKLGRYVLKDIDLFGTSKKEQTMAQGWIVESKAKLKALGGV